MAEDRSRAYENRDRAHHDWRIPLHNADQSLRAAPPIVAPAVNWTTTTPEWSGAV